MNTKQQARFWHWHNGTPVLIKMNAGDRLHVHSKAHNGEGWTHDAYVWEFDGETVTEQWERWGRDCDGGFSSSSEYRCPLSDLRAGYFNEEDRVAYPAWRDGRTSQYDERAEQAGY